MPEILIHKLSLSIKGIQSFAAACARSEYRNSGKNLFVLQSLSPTFN